MIKIRYRFTGLLMLIFLPVILAGQFTKFAEKGQEKAQIVEKNYPVHVSHILNSEEFLSRFEGMRTERQVRKADDPLGTVTTFKVYNLDTDVFDDVEFKLMRKGSVSQLWFATGEISNGHLTEDVADTMIAYLETKTNSNSFDPNKGVIALGNEVFGDPPDYDGDGFSDVFVCDVQDGWDSETGGGYVAGFFFSHDQTSQSGSNQRDVIYIDSYPGIYNGSSADPLKPLSTLSHEYQHLIHYNYDNLETFLNESQSCFASLLTGYVPHGSYYQYLGATNIALLQWYDASVFPEYGRAAVFSAYLWDQMGFEKAGYLTQAPFSGAAGIDSALSSSGSDWKYADLLVNWGLANYINDRGVNTAYGYENPLLTSWKASPGLVVTDPNVTSKSLYVKRSAVYYYVYEGVKDLDLTASFTGEYGRMKVITRLGDTYTVTDLASGGDFTSTAGVVYDEIILMLVNTEPGHENRTMDTVSMPFKVNSTGTAALANASTYSTAKYYTLMPRYSASSSQPYRYGISNQYTVNPGGYLSKLRLYLLTGVDSETQEPIEVKGTGKIRLAIYTDISGQPGSVVVQDSVDFSELTNGTWNEFDVSGWSYPIEKNVPFHVVYEFVVPVLDSDVNCVPLRLDDGTGVQNVSHVITGIDPEVFGTAIQDGELDLNFWNEIVFLIDPAVSIEDENVFTPLEFRLQQNYPNPFNPTTVIKYQIPSASDVNLTIYNSVGQKVRTLYSGQRNAGTYEASWDGKNQLGVQVSSGIYFYQLKAGQQQQVNKMILMR